jgi:hypothetical protein
LSNQIFLSAKSVQKFLAHSDAEAAVELPVVGLTLAGYTNGSGGHTHGFWLLHTDAGGRMIWSKIYHGTTYVVNNDCNAMIQTSDGGYALAGQTFVSAQPSIERYWLVRTNGDGDSLWSKTYIVNEDYWKVFYSLVQTDDEGFGLIGSNFMLRTNADGDSLWSKTFAGTFRSIMLAPSGGFILSGGNGDFYLLRTDEEGDSLWSASFGGARSDFCNDAIITRDGGFALAGTTNSFYGDDNFWLVKTGPDPLSVRGSDFIPHPSSFILLPPYPNPFNGAVTLTFQLQKPGLAALELLDPAGRRVAKLFEGFVQAGERKVLWNGDAVSSGVYWIRLRSNGFSAAEKAVKVK